MAVVVWEGDSLVWMVESGFLVLVLVSVREKDGEGPLPGLLYRCQLAVGAPGGVLAGRGGVCGKGMGYEI